MVISDQLMAKINYNGLYVNSLRLVVMSFIHLLYSPAELAREVGENAKTLRLSRNLSRKTLAIKSGVSESTIKRFEMTGVVTLEALILMATALDELSSVAKLFKPEHPNNYEELKNTKRKRGMQ
ncbi:helix-turn-helix domain-containing protein [Erwinia amylovora]|uniref:Transcriptional regulator n=3 Tax=Erwinia amylovora TaxID=552 RepID=A0A0P0ZH04_ERWAM|nr:helix-turn-helix transcriptional regulator [Erwinia amylovora]CDK23747.1 transcriptional regulator [Erwinia amylovora LA635]CDK23791.1 hypothetical protein LA636_p1013 [Erwinia amylovora LA636]CDK23841.1 hypothetical protein LA637_p1014 [Erwinia amylovora LA637]MCK8164758.1 helix-turn-helix domain-containing protein [Erwinia amylovora]MCK8211789.1 helix-turn-helix domain-containing protein [Erwinia amylovora]